MRSLLCVVFQFVAALPFTGSCVLAQMEQRAAMPQSVPIATRETPAAVAQYVRYDSAKQVIYLRHIRVVDGTGAPALEKATVVLASGKIRNVLPSDSPAGQRQSTPVARLSSI